MSRRRIRLQERVDELLKESNKVCRPKRHCAALQAVIDVFDGRRPGISVEPFISLRSGKTMPPRVVLFTRAHEFAELSYCPFCGEKVNRKKRASRKKAS